MEDSTPFDFPAKLDPAKILELFVELDAPHCFDDLIRAYDAAAQLDDSVNECVNFRLLQKERLDELTELHPEHSIRKFWIQVAQLLIFVSRSAPSAMDRLIEGVMMAVSAKNELVLALVMRAWREQISSLLVLAKAIESNHERLRVAWARISDEEPTDADRLLRRSLIQYTLGRRVNSSIAVAPSLEDGAKAWEDFQKQSAIDKKSEISTEHINNALRAVRETEGFGHWLAVYDELCEYCHPNGASRALDFATQIGLKEHTFSFKQR